MMKRQNYHYKKHPLSRATIAIGLAVVLSVFPVLSSGTQAEEPSTQTIGHLLRGDIPLCDGDTISLSEVLTWRVPLTLEVLTDAPLQIPLPEGLLPQRGKPGILADGGNNKYAEIETNSSTVTVVLPELLMVEDLSADHPEMSENKTVSAQASAESSEMIVSDNEQEEVTGSTPEQSSDPNADSAPDFISQLSSPEHTADRSDMTASTAAAEKSLRSAVHTDLSIASVSASTSSSAATSFAAQSAESVDSSPAVCSSEASAVARTDPNSSTESASPHSPGFSTSYEASVSSGTELEGPLTLSIPCLVDMAQVNPDGTIQVAGLTLHITGTARAGSPPPYRMSLCTKDSNGKPGRPVVPNETVSIEDDFFIWIHWDALTGALPNIDYVMDEYPDGLSAPAVSGSQTFAASMPDGSTKDFVALSWLGASRELTATFIDLGRLSTGEEILPLLLDANIYYDCSMDKNGLTSDQNGKADFVFPGGNTISVIVKEHIPQPPKLTKSVSTIDAQGIATWTINYQHPVTAYSGNLPASLVDIPPAGLTISGNPEVSVNDAPAAPSGEIIVDPDGQKLTYSVPNSLPAGAKVVITYQTEFTNAELSKIWSKAATSYSYNNRVEARNAADAPIVPATFAAATLSITDQSWPTFDIISKTGETTKPTTPGGDWTVKWTVTVRTASRGFKTLHVIDTLGKGLILDNSTVKVNGTVLTAPELGTAADGDRTEMTIRLVENGIPATAAAEYQITYTTKIKPDYFDQTGSDPLTDADLQNEARLYYDWPVGTYPGPGSPPMPPSIVKKPGDISVSGALIQKKAISYNRTDHSMIWNVILNPNKVDLTTALVVDDLSFSVLPTYHPHAFTPSAIGDPAELSAAKDKVETAVKASLPAGATLNQIFLDDQTLTLSLSHIGRNTVEFELTTYVANPEIWAANVTNKQFFNKITLIKDSDFVSGVKLIGTTVSNVTIQKDVPADATQKYSGNVLAKEHTAYDPANHKMTWILTVNQNKTGLGAVDITDALPQGLSCDPADATLDGGAFAGSDTFEVIPSGSGQEIKIHLNHVTDQQVITFKTTVGVNSNSFQENKSVTFNNTAQIMSDPNGNWVPSNQSTATLDNKVVDKSNARSGTQVTYTVRLNPVGMDLLGQGNTRLQLTDTLSDGLYLDIDSVKLYEAVQTAKKSGNKYEVNLTQGPTINPLSDLSYDAPNNAFTITIPDATKSYFLTYTAHIVRSNLELTNQVELVGSVIPSNVDHYKKTSKFTMSAFGNASFALPAQSFFSVQIGKVDDTGGKLSGAQFGLYRSIADATPFATATCDPDTGVATLAVPIRELNGLNTLYWKELVAPQGYVLNDQWHSLDIDTQNQTSLKFANQKPADATAGEIKIQLIDVATGSSLTGALFRLYKDEFCTQLAGTETVDQDGKLTFSGLYPGRGYWLRQVTVPPGYVLPSGPILVEASKIPIPQPVENEKAEATLVIVKVDAEDKSLKLDGAKFSLYTDAAFTNFVATQSTALNGECSFTGLQPNASYYLRETTAPNGYKLNSVYYTLQTQGNGTVVKTQIENHAIGWDEKASIQLVKTDGDSGRRLAGAHFSLYDQSKNTLIGSAATTSNGLCSFTALKAGTYYLKETKAPNGYTVSQEWTQVAVTQNAATEVAVTNQKLESSESSSESSTSVSSREASSEASSRHTFQPENSSRSWDSSRYRSSVSASPVGSGDSRPLIVNTNETPPATSVSGPKGVWAGVMLAIVSVIWLCILYVMRAKHTRERKR